MRAVACQQVPRSLLRSVHWTDRSRCAGPLFTPGQHRLGLHFGQQKRGERAQSANIFRQRFGDIQHGAIIANPGLYGNPRTAEYLTLSGGQGPPSALRQPPLASGKPSTGLFSYPPHPSSGIASWAGVSAILPSLADGQTKRPFSKRFESEPLERHWSGRQWRTQAPSCVSGAPITPWRHNSTAAGRRSDFVCGR